MTTAVWERPRVIHTKKEYQAVMDEIYRLLDLNKKKGTPEDERLELLTLLAEDYETRTEPAVPLGKPQSIVEFMLDQKGLTKADLVKPMGGNSRVSEFFAGKRALSTNQIKALRALLGIPADLLIGDQQDNADDMTTAAVTLAYTAKSGKPMMVTGAAKPKKLAEKSMPSSAKFVRAAAKKK